VVRTVAAQGIWPNPFLTAPFHWLGRLQRKGLAEMQPSARDAPLELSTVKALLKAWDATPPKTVSNHPR
jgi:hypothetical protein